VIRRTFSGRREVALGLGLYAVYLGVRALVYDDEGRRRADRNALRILALERRLGLDVEPALQRLLLPRKRVIAILNVAYVTLNVAVTVAWPALLYASRDPRFFRYRTALALALAAPQPIFLLFPTSPPRKLEQLTDTIAEAGFDLESGLVAKLYCPIAAMPSIHLAFAVVTGAAVRATASRRWLRTGAPAYAPAVALTVVVTANHYVLDTVAGALLGAGALRVARLIEG
jgi:membrane-associated phospholipid phosphatase